MAAQKGFIRGFIIYPTYRVIENKAYIYLYGRLDNGESFLAIKHMRPYFYIRQSDQSKAEKLLRLDYEKTDMADIQGNPVTRVLADNPRDVPGMRQLFLDNNIVCYEADIRFAYRYLIDNRLRGSILIAGEHEQGSENLKVSRIYEEPTLQPSDHEPKLRTLSVDIETDIKAKELFAIGLYSHDFERVLIRKQGRFRKAESIPDEKRLLERFMAIIAEQDPDIILGWNFIDFDLKILKELCAKHRIPFRLGRDSSETSLSLSTSFFVDSTAKCTGRMILDGISLLKQSFIRLHNYKLQTAAQAFLKEEKIFSGEGRFREIEKAFRDKPQLLIDYNLLDAKLALEVAEKSGALPLTITRSRLTGMQLDRVKASIASLDSLYLHEMQHRKLVAPTANPEDRDERIIGGFVREPKPGIYTNIIVMDFKSLYPSIIRTFNIDPVSYVDRKQLRHMSSKEREQLIEAPNGAHFRNDDGILPVLIQRLWEQRDAAKRKKDRLEGNAIKILMNSMFGVLANPTCRFYSLEVGNAITHFGQHLIKMAAEKIEKDEGYEVIYGDTDSLFINTGEKEYRKAISHGREVQHAINSFFGLHIRKEYHRKSFMELEFEKVYKRFLMPHVRGSEKGAKKRYAGIVERDGRDEVDIVGLEFVRSDWTEIAKEFQLGLLNRIFRDRDVTGYIKTFVDDIRAGRHDDKLVYSKAIRKTVKEYTKTTPPHIQAARKIGRDSVGIINYYMTLNGPEAAEALKSKIDYKHYIEKQLRPIADAVLTFFGKTFDELTQKERQKGLGEY